MEWILKIIGGFIVVSILWGIGLIPEFICMIITSLFIGVISGGVALLFDWGNFDSGFLVGIWIGVGIYALYCIARIVSDEVIITGYTDGSTEETSPRFAGIVGLIVVIASLIFAFTR